MVPFLYQEENEVHYEFSIILYIGRHAACGSGAADREAAYL